MNMNICPDSVPKILGLFDLSVAPPLLFYAYIPAIAVALAFGYYIFIKDNRSLQSKLLLGIALSFSIWVLNLLFQWTVAYIKIDMFSWQITPFFEILIPILSIYFTYVFINKKDIPLSAKIVFSFFVITLAITIPTQFNTISFDYQNCEANYGDVYYRFVYIFELLAICIVEYICIKKYLTTPKEDLPTRQQAVSLALGSALFLTVFFLSNILGEFTQIYQINLFGPIGILAFIGFISFMIIRHGLFNIKLFATQALVVGISILIGAQLFSPSDIFDEIVTVSTLIAFLVAGFFLIRSVRREIEQRELIEKQEQELEVVNAQQENLLHFVSHEVKGYLTESEAGFAAIAEGDLGPIPPQLKTMAENALTKVRKGVATVMDILKASDMKKGTVAYKKVPLDFRDVVQSIVSEQKSIAYEKHLDFEVNIVEGKYGMEGDEEKLRDHVIRNLIDNAIRYTPAGTISIELSDGGGKIRFAVKDSGVGITSEDMTKLFTEGGHGKDSIRVNVHSTGYGLFIAKQVIDAHGGKIWAESEGAGKGAKFIVELPTSYSSND